MKNLFKILFLLFLVIGILLNLGCGNDDEEEEDNEDSDQTSLTWTWVSGSDTEGERGSYGTMGTADSSNIPGARHYSTSWIDSDGNLWLFGGNGYDKDEFDGYLNDLWMFNPLTEEWTWVSGNETVDQSGVYGSKGEASTLNVPGAREDSISWTGSEGNLWLFGGNGYDVSGNFGELNDLWIFDVSTRNWIWISGSDTYGQSGSYGTMGTANASNIPGARDSSISWKGSDGALYLFGGYGYDKDGIDGELNDLWMFNVSTWNWTWISGSNTYGQSGSYGTMGTADSSNIPGARDSSISWIDSNGNLWLFGGYGYDKDDIDGDLNDLWIFDVSARNWTWISGSSTYGQSGSYGTMGTPSASNYPGARSYSISWIGSDGNLWLFGGWGYDANGDEGDLDDLWKFDLSTKGWSWVSGSELVDQSGVYGSKGVASISKIPGAREASISWTDPDGNLWLFGGYGYDKDGIDGELNDLWMFVP